MSTNPIPPLLCNTPPPIDEFDKIPEDYEDEDSDSFGDFETGNHLEGLGPSLPATPRHLNKIELGKSELLKDVQPNLSFENNQPDLEKPDNLKKNTIKGIDSSLYQTAAKTQNNNLCTEPEESNNKSNAEIDSNVSAVEDLAENFGVKETNEETISYTFQYCENENEFDSEPTVKSNSLYSELTVKSNESYSNPIVNTDELVISEQIKLLEVECGSTENEIHKIVSLEKEPECTENESNKILGIMVPSNNDIYDSVILYPPTTSESVDKKNYKEENVSSSKFEEIKVSNENISFDADFSQFEQLPPPAEELKSILVSNVNERNIEFDDFDEFDNFQDFQSTEQKLHFSDKKIEDKDDDFGEFATASEEALESKFVLNTENLNERIESILGCMFPKEDNPLNENNFGIDKILLNLNSVETAHCLEFKFTKSCTRHSLIKSLGIDSRNILYGDNWNSSMPRFAANLGFSPLEPKKIDSSSASNLEPSKTSDTNTSTTKFDWNSSAVNPLDGIEEITHEREIETIHSTKSYESDTSVANSTTSIEEPTITHNNTTIFDEQQKQPNEDVKNDEFSEFSKPIATAPIDIINDVNVNLPESTSTFIASQNVSDIDESFQQHYNKVDSKNNGIIVDEAYSGTKVSNYPHHLGSTGTNFMLPLKETHIFTPSKTDKPISRSMNNEVIDFEIAAAVVGTIIDESVIKKEYHDVEYNPVIIPNESYCGSSDPFGDFKINLPSINDKSCGIINKAIENYEFGDRPRTENKEAVKTNCKFDFKADNDTCNDHNNLKTFDDEKYIYSKNSADNIFNNKREEKFEFVETFPNNSDVNQISVELLSNSINPPKAEATECDKEFKNLDNIDDDFSDFQSVPPIHKISNQEVNSTKLVDGSCNSSRTNTPMDMILSPAILLPKTIKLDSCQLEIDWPQPGINPEELARIETLFPQRSAFPAVATSSKKSENNVLNEDDDWSDFISVPIQHTLAQQSNQQKSVLNTIYCPTSPTKVARKEKLISNKNNDDDEWSDFVSSGPLTSQYQKPENQFRQISSSGNVFQTKNLYNNVNVSSQLQLPSQNFATASAFHKNFKDKKPDYYNIINNSNNSSTSNLRNNKMTQYLLNNCSSSEPKNLTQINTALKPIDFLPNHHQQTLNNHQLFKNNSTSSRSNNLYRVKSSSNYGGSGNSSGNNISLIPNLGFIAPTSTLSTNKQNFPNISIKNQSKQFITKK